MGVRGGGSRDFQFGTRGPTRWPRWLTSSGMVMPRSLEYGSIHKSCFHLGPGNMYRSSLHDTAAEVLGAPRTVRLLQGPQRSSVRRLNVLAREMPSSGRCLDSRARDQTGS